jgi:hypothetical protein
MIHTTETDIERALALRSPHVHAIVAELRQSRAEIAELRKLRDNLHREIDRELNKRRAAEAALQEALNQAAAVPLQCPAHRARVAERQEGLFE